MVHSEWRGYNRPMHTYPRRKSSPFCVRTLGLFHIKRWGYIEYPDLETGNTRGAQYRIDLARCGGYRVTPEADTE